MEKMASKKICVSCSPQGNPLLIKRDRNQLTVEKILEAWNDTGSWWEGESEKRFFRLYCREGQLLEIFHDLVSGEWYIYRIYD